MKKGITIDELRSRLESLGTEDRMAALKVFARIGIDLTQQRNDLIGAGVAGFILGNRFHEANSHKAVMLKVAEIILKKHPDKEEKIFTVQGRKKTYFSKSPSDFRRHHELISGTQIYADTNENAAQLNRRCQKILLAFGMDPSSLMIIPR